LGSKRMAAWTNASLPALVSSSKLSTPVVRMTRRAIMWTKPVWRSTLAAWSSVNGGLMRSSVRHGLLGLADVLAQRPLLFVGDRVKADAHVARARADDRPVHTDVRARRWEAQDQLDLGPLRLPGWPGEAAPAQRDVLE